MKLATRITAYLSIRHPQIRPKVLYDAAEAGLISQLPRQLHQASRQHHLPQLKAFCIGWSCGLSGSWDSCFVERQINKDKL